MTHVAVASKAPKTVKFQYFVTVLKPNTTTYSTCLLCKNYTEAKKLYKQYIKESNNNDLVSLILTINRNHGEETRTSDLVLARTIGTSK